MDGCDDTSDEIGWSVGLYVSSSVSLFASVQEIFKFDFCCGSLHILRQLVPYAYPPIIWTFLNLG